MDKGYHLYMESNFEKNTQTYLQNRPTDFENEFLVTRVETIGRRIN